MRIAGKGGCLPCRFRYALPSPISSPILAAPLFSALSLRYWSGAESDLPARGRYGASGDDRAGNYKVGTWAHKKPMSHNTFGHLFRVTTWGESHGPAIGCVIDGCPPGIPLDDRRHPGLSRQAPARPVALHHAAARARPGAHPLRRVHRRGTAAGHHRHADRARHRQRRRAVQGLRRHQGQVPPRPRRLHLSGEIRHPRLPRRGPSSARETAIRVAAGAVARKVVPGVRVRGALVQIGPHTIDRAQLGLGRGRAATRSSAPTPRP